MAGPGLTTSLTGTPHPADHNVIHGMLNKFDTGTPATGNLLRWNGSLWVPYALTVDDMPANIGVVVLASAGSRPTTDANRIVVAVGGATPPAWGLTNDVHIASA